MLKLGRSGWRIAGLGLVTATILLAAGCGDDGGSSSGGGGTAASSLQGAGATFPEPVYTKMFGQLNEQEGIQVNYQAIGSGAGSPSSPTRRWTSAPRTRP